MKRSTAIRVYFCGVFLVLLSNLANVCFGAIGIHGVALYHMQCFLVGAAVLHAGMLVLSGRFRTHANSALLRLVLCSIGYTTVSCLFLLRFGDIVPAYVAMMLYTFLIYPLSAITLLACSNGDRQQPTMRSALPEWLPWAALAILLFGWVQFAGRDTIIHAANSERVSKLVAADVLGTFRPPSIFESSFQYGLFSVLVMSLSGANAIFGRRGVGSWIVAFVALLSVALSQTRNVFLCAAASLLTLFLVRISRDRSGFRSRLRWMPLAYLAASITIVFLAVWRFLNADLARTGDLADASSALARVSGWLTAWQRLVIPGNWFDLFFGYGVTQAGHASDFHSLYPARADGLFIDNTFVNLFLFQGLIGLVLFLATYWTIWSRLLRYVESSPEPFGIGITCFFSAFLAAGVLNILSGQWWGITFALSLIVLSGMSRDEDQCAP